MLLVFDGARVPDVVAVLLGVAIVIVVCLSVSGDVAILAVAI